jgi:16S rRNA processing protein RimM
MSRKTRPADNGSGSPTGEPVYLTVGFVRRPHGTRGELIMDIHTEFPERLHAGTEVFLGDEHQPMKLASVRLHGNAMLVSFRGLDSPEKAGCMRNTWVYITTASIPALPEGSFYQHQILGLRVVTETGQELGRLVDIFETGANKIYVVETPDKKEILLPAIPDVILDINIPKGEIKVHLLDGLIV